MKFPLFETLCIENSEIKNVALHQRRYENALATFYAGKIEKSAVKIQDLFAIIQENLKNHTALFDDKTHLIRCRIAYNEQDYEIAFFPYERKKYQRFQSVICDEIDYSLKYNDRTLLNKLLEQKGDADEIMIIKQGKVTDCSIGNLVFREGNQWFTPDSPLLKGTQRENLLKLGKIQETQIFAEDISKFDEIRLINAMNNLEP